MSQPKELIVNGIGIYRMVGGLVLDAISGIFYRSKGQNLTGFGTSDQKYQK